MSKTTAAQSIYYTPRQHTWCPDSRDADTMCGREWALTWATRCDRAAHADLRRESCMMYVWICGGEIRSEGIRCANLGGSEVWTSKCDQSTLWKALPCTACPQSAQYQDRITHLLHAYKLMWVLEIQVAPEANWSAPYTLYWLTSGSASIGRPAKDDTVVDVVVAGDSSGMYRYGNIRV